MSRHKNIVPSVRVETSLPAPLALRLELYLTSGVLGKRPAAARQRFFTQLLEDFFTRLAAQNTGAAAAAKDIDRQIAADAKRRFLEGE